MIPLLAAIVLAGAAGAGPVLVSDACGNDGSDSAEDNRCAVEAAEKKLAARPRPKELKVEADGQLYSVPAGVEMIEPPASPVLGNFWKDCLGTISRWAGRDNASNKTKTASSSEETEGGGDSSTGAEKPSEAKSAGEHSCQICFENDHDTAILPCGHGGLCWECGVQIFALTEECPMCRAKIELIVQLDYESRRREGEQEFVSAVVSA